MTIISTDQSPRVWIGCLACHNTGRLVGDRLDVVSADKVTTYDLRGHAPVLIFMTSCEW